MATATVSSSHFSAPTKRPPLVKRSSTVAELSETFEYTLTNWSHRQYRSPFAEKTTRSYFIDSPVFFLCGNDWIIRVYPQGLDENGSSHISVMLRNMSSNEVHIRYSITLVNQVSGEEDYSWEDSEGIVEFEGYYNGGSNEWGCEEFMTLEDAVSEKAGFLVDDSFRFVVEMEVYGVVNIDAHPLNKAIENAADDGDLIALADKDLSLIVKSLPLGKGDNIARRQDNLVTGRLVMSSLASGQLANNRKAPKPQTPYN